MRNEKLRQQTYRKLQLVMGGYASLIYEKTGEIENAEYLMTREHLRSVPVSGWQPLGKNMPWGGMDVNLWVRGKYTVKPSEAGRKLLAVSHADGREELFFVNGEPTGLFSWKNRAVSAEHAERLITQNAQAGEEYELALECLDRLRSSGQDPFSPSAPEDDYDPAKDDEPGCVYGGIDICMENEELRAFTLDMRELLQIALDLPDMGYLKSEAERVLDKVAENLILCPREYGRDEWMRSVRQCLTFTRSYFTGHGNPLLGDVSLVGHSHLDTAWLWPVRETIRKSARTFSSVLSIMDEYPGFIFMQSSTLHTQWLEKYYPTIFERLKKQVSDGRYEINGGAFVECDCNLSSGETMLRQFIVGQRFMKENFGRQMDTFWLPDTFGYNGNIPQMMLGCGLKYFATNKLNCNEINAPEHQSFLWRGIDGSTVLTHIPSSGGHADVKDAFSAAMSVTDKTESSKRLLAFGFGDGGGGPTRDMAEEALRVMSCPAAPEASMNTVSGFFRRLEEDRKRLPIYDGELYFEFHRGTLTQNHDVKRMNRHAENALHALDYALVRTGSGRPENYEEDLELLLTNQFHDILPGTCINSVYDVYRTEMTDLIARMRDETRSLLSAGGKADLITVHNTSPFVRRDPVRLYDEFRLPDGYPAQVYTDILGRSVTAVGGVVIPAYGAAVLSMNGLAVSRISPFTYSTDLTHIETPLLSITFKDGIITSLIHKPSGRQTVRDGGALNRFVMAEDLPEKWDNWNIDSDTMDRLSPCGGYEGSEVISDGPFELRIRSAYRVSSASHITQDMVLYADSARIDFHTLLDWNDKHKLLKAAFETDLRARNAKCEIQLGHIERPTHQSTSYDMAKFEVCNHKWTDLSESDFGAAVLNDCKYGVSLKDSDIALTLQRGGTVPDGTGDRGRHEFTYSFLPHEGSLSAQNVIAPAYHLNSPHVCVKGSGDTEPFVSVSDPAIIAETIKNTEEGGNGFVLRLYECEGSARQTKITLSRSVRGVWLTDMLENRLTRIESDGHDFELSFRAFEIKTVLVEPGTD